MERINLGDIYNQNFVFAKYEPDTVIKRKLDYVRYGEDGENLTDLNYFVKDYYLSLWKKWNLFLSNTRFSSFEIKEGESLSLRSSMTESQYKAIIFCMEEPYGGAFFIYKIGKKVKKIKPKFGDIVFIKTGDKNISYGITKNKSDHSLKYLVIDGGLSKKESPDIFHKKDINSFFSNDQQ